MAIDITINLTDEREVELIAMTAGANRIAPPDQQVTPAQFLRQYVRNWLDLSAQLRADQAKLGMRAAYKLATPEEQATIDTILNQYRTGTASLR